MAKRIWLVSSGSYSDYSVHCVAASKAVAEKIAKKMRGVKDGIDRDADVEERMLISSVDEVERRAVYNVNVDSDGRETKRWTYVEWPWGMPDEGAAWGNLKYGIGGRSSRGYAAALKSARDHLAAEKAKEL